MKIGICIPTYNDLNLLEELLNSIETKYPYKVFIFDNSTNDDIGNFLEAGYPVEYYKSPVNAGISKGANGAWKMAYNDPEITHLLYCNHDILFAPNTIDDLVWAWNNKTTRIKIVSGREIRGDSPQHEGKALEKFKQPETVEKKFAFGACYACFMFDKATLDDCGYLHEEVDYYDDNLYSLDMCNKGFFPVIYLPAKYFHHGSFVKKSLNQEENKVFNEKFKADREWAFNYCNIKSQEELRGLQEQAGAVYAMELEHANQQLKARSEK